MEDELVWGKEDGAEETLDTLGPGRIVSKKKVGKTMPCGRCYSRYGRYGA